MLLAAGVFTAIRLWKCEWMRRINGRFYFLFLNTAHSNILNLFKSFHCWAICIELQEFITCINLHIKINNFAKCSCFSVASDYFLVSHLSLCAYKDRSLDTWFSFSLALLVWVQCVRAFKVTLTCHVVSAGVRSAKKCSPGVQAPR